MKIEKIVHLFLLVHSDRFNRMWLQLWYMGLLTKSKSLCIRVSFTWKYTYVIIHNDILRKWFTLIKYFTFRLANSIETQACKLNSCRISTYTKPRSKICREYLSYFGHMKRRNEHTYLLFNSGHLNDLFHLLCLRTHATLELV